MARPLRPLPPPPLNGLAINGRFFCGIFRGRECTSFYYTCPWRTYSQPLITGFTDIFLLTSPVPDVHIHSLYLKVSRFFFSPSYTFLGVITQNLHFQVSRMYFFLLHLSLADILKPCVYRCRECTSFCYNCPWRNNSKSVFSGVANVLLSASPVLGGHTHGLPDPAPGGPLDSHLP